SLIWSQILSGWPSVTDSEVNSSFSAFMNVLLIEQKPPLHTKKDPLNVKGSWLSSTTLSSSRSFCRIWHLPLTQWLPRFQRAGPSTSLDKCIPWRERGSLLMAKLHGHLFNCG